ELELDQLLFTPHSQRRSRSASLTRVGWPVERKALATSRPEQLPYRLTNRFSTDNDLDELVDHRMRRSPSALALLQSHCSQPGAFELFLLAQHERLYRDARRCC